MWWWSKWCLIELVWLKGWLSDTVMWWLGTWELGAANECHDRVEGSDIRYQRLEIGDQRLELEQDLTQEFSLCPYPFHLVRNCRQSAYIQLSNTCSILKFSSPSQRTGGGGRAGCQPGMGSCGAGVSLMMWLSKAKTVCLGPNLLFNKIWAKLSMCQLLQ